MQASPSTHSEAEQQPALPDMRRIVSLLPHTPVEQLQKDRPFAVACVDTLDNDIFVVFHNWITDEFNYSNYHKDITNSSAYFVGQ
jgi:hypothetical protein